MAKKVLTGKVNGYFDCRAWKANTPKENQKIKGEDESISFSVIYSAAELPEALSRYAKPFEDKNHDQRFRVTFKLGGKVTWYDAAAQQITKPSNAELDGKNFNACIEYVELNGNPDNKEACGYWVNQIQIEEVKQNPFTSWMPDNNEPSDSDLV